MTMIEGRATARYVRTSAQKAKLVMDLIRGQSVDRALATLRFSQKRVAGAVAKVLRSAVANAEQKEGAAGDVERMFVSRCYADQGPSMKRIRPAPMGRAFRIVKRTAHLTVHVEERPEAIVPAPGEPGSAGAGGGSSRRGAKRRSSRRPKKRSSGREPAG